MVSVQRCFSEAGASENVLVCAAANRTTRPHPRAIIPSYHHTPCHHTILSYDHAIIHTIKPSYHHAIKPSNHHAIIPFCHHIIIPLYHSVIISSYRHTIIPSSHHLIIPSYHNTIIPPYHHTVMPSYQHAHLAGSDAAAAVVVVPAENVHQPAVEPQAPCRTRANANDKNDGGRTPSVNQRRGGAEPRGDAREGIRRQHEKDEDVLHSIRRRSRPRSRDGLRRLSAHHVRRLSLIHI